MKEFKTIEEIVCDSIFKKYLSDTVDEILRKRRLRPAAPMGFKYKRDWYDQLQMNGNCNSLFFSNNIKAVFEHKSNLSSLIRGVVEYAGKLALSKTIEFYTSEIKK